MQNVGLKSVYVLKFAASIIYPLLHLLKSDDVPHADLHRSTLISSLKVANM